MYSHTIASLITHYLFITQLLYIFLRKFTFSLFIHLFSSVETLCPIDQEPAVLTRRLLPANDTSVEEEDDEENLNGPMSSLEVANQTNGEVIRILCKRWLMNTQLKPAT